MRIDEPIETKGYFWLQEEPDHRLPGVLKISESSVISVELAGLLNRPSSLLQKIMTAGPSSTDDEPDIERLVGLVEKGGLVTLDRCYRHGLRFGGELINSTLQPSLAFMGVRYEDDEQATFSEFRFSIDGLDAWLSVSSIAIEQDFDDYSGYIRFRLPDEIQITIGNDVGLEFAFGLRFPSMSLPMTRASVEQTASIRVKTKTPQPLEFFSSIARKLCNLLSLALDEDVGIQYMSGYLDYKTDNGEERKHQVRIYGEFQPWISRTPNIRSHRALFLYPEISDSIKDLVSKWFDNYDRLEPAIDLYFASRTQNQAFLQARVLWLAQALESLHRRTSQETEMPDAEFKSRIDEIAQNCPSDIQKWVRDKLLYANQLSFRTRIDRLVDPFATWFGRDDIERQYFVNRVRNTRNYLTHYGQRPRKNTATNPTELFALHQKMEALLQFHLLNLIGFDQQWIASLVERNVRLRRKVNG